MVMSEVGHAHSPLLPVHVCSVWLCEHVHTTQHTMHRPPMPDGDGNGVVVGGSAVDCQSYSDVWDTLTEGVGGWSTTVTLTLGAHYSNCQECQSTVPTGGNLTNTRVRHACNTGVTRV